MKYFAIYSYKEKQIEKIQLFKISKSTSLNIRWKNERKLLFFIKETCILKNIKFLWSHDLYLHINEKLLLRI